MHRKLIARIFPAAGVSATIVSRHAAGLTLAEVVVASSLLIMAMVPIIKGLTNAHLNSIIIEHRTHSLILAQAKMDEIKARSIYNYDSSFTESDTSLDGPYLCNVTDNSAGANLRTITVSVGYDLDANGSLSSGETRVTLSTQLARRW